MQTFLTVLLSLFITGCYAGDAAELAAKFRKVADYQAVRADFVQTRRMAELDMQVEIKGEMICEKNGRLRWQVKSPVRSVTVIGKNDLRHFDAETGKMNVIRPEKFPWLQILRECMSDWISGDPERLSRRFELTAKDGRTLRLFPKENQLKQIFKAVEIQADERFGAIESIVIEEKSGDRLEIRFLKVRKNPALTENDWRMPPI